MQPPDQPEREAALDTSRSFIVQAPAGSGKTELLIQRYLRLLATVAEPEEVLAVTFTHKAAGEMRGRVIKALVEAQEQRPPEAAHLRRAYDLAREVLGDEQRQRWQLHRHPARLRITTIDAVNASIAYRNPIAGGANALQGIAPAPERLYEEAALATLGLMADDDDAGTEAALLMRHLDNDAARFQRLMVTMLPKRDQWLRHAAGSRPGRDAIEAPLRRLTQVGIQCAASALPADAAAELLALLPFAADFLGGNGKAHHLAPWTGRSTWPAATAEEWPAWRALADALLTADEGTWRQKIDKNCGFPPQTPEKARMEALLGKLAGREDLRLALIAVRGLPGAGYTDEQWEMLRSLLAVLRLAAAQLRLVQAAHGITDFAGVAAAALDALGAEDAPSDLALLLDHRLQHILVDEFQDTSLAQFTLLARLTAGWTPGDGRSLFVVGDPMQSIYGFREADVRLFAQLRDHGIGDLRPAFLQLRANFRSTPALVDWCNGVFARTFAGADDTLVGAVRFAPSLPTSGGAAPGGSGKLAASWHWRPAGDQDAEPALVLDLVATARREDPAQRICILVRSRAHAGPIIAALRAAGVGFVAPEIELLERSGVCLDLLALTRALSHRADRLAWIGVLRAPFCGLSLADLECLLGDDHQAAVVDLLHDTVRRERLSPAGAAAVARLCGVLERTEAVRERCTLRDRVEAAWLMLGGPATIPEASQLESAMTFLDLLEEGTAGDGGLDHAWLAARMKAHKGSLGSGDSGLQVMTIHKAKGLEFDTVILPGLGKPAPSEDPPLLLWQDVPMADGRMAPLLAPIPATGADRDPVYAYVMKLRERKRELEADRLLYVACTRARRRLHLVAQLELARGDGHAEVRRPSAKSLLARLWSAVSAEASAAVRAATWEPAAASPGPPPRVQPVISRLPATWQVPPPPAALSLPTDGPDPGAAAPVVYEWAGFLAMHVGTVVHRWLQIMADEGLERCTAKWLRERQPLVRRMLSNLGVPPRELDAAARRVTEALERTLRDERGRWLLSGQHGDAASELAVTVCEDSRFRNLVVDRSFRDADGTRWVVDFKTSRHEGGDIEAFILEEVARYRGQLQGYREAMQALTGDPVRTALYFPLLGVFREVAAAPDDTG